MTQPREEEWPTPSRAALLPYAAASLAVLAILGAGVVWASRQPAGPLAPDTEDVVVLDMTPAPASALPPSEAPDGPPQEARDAVASAPPAQDAPKVPELEEPPPPSPAAPAAPKPETGEAPPPTAAQEARAPSGSQAPVKDADPLDSEAAPAASARAMNRWQRALLSRIEEAKRGLRANGLEGTVSVGFTMDRHGLLVSSAVARSSGSPRLDAAALALIARATPFPAPPADAPDAVLRFTVPIAFTRRR